MKGWKEARLKESVSNLARKRLAYEGAILVPVAVPYVCKLCLLLKEELFIVRIMHMRSQSVSTDGWSVAVACIENMTTGIYTLVMRDVGVER